MHSGNGEAIFEIRSHSVVVSFAASYAVPFATCDMLSAIFLKDVQLVLDVVHFPNAFSEWPPSEISGPLHALNCGLA